MVWAAKCCYFVPIQKGTVLIGFGSLIVSTLFSIASIVLLVLNERKKSLQKYYIHQILHWNAAEISIPIILWIGLIFSLLWVLASLILLVGLKMNKPSFVLTYFSFGIFATMLFMLTALLELLQGYWIIPIIQVIISMIYIHYLVVLHTAYDMMINGKTIGITNRLEIDETPIVDYSIED